jgi:hypothetical protein
MPEPEVILSIGGAALGLALLLGVIRLVRGLNKVRGDLDRRPTLASLMPGPTAPFPAALPPTGVDLRLVLRLPLQGRFGSPEEQASHARLVTAVNAGLAAHRIERTVGPFVARGVVYLTVAHVPPTAWDDALSVVQAGLDREGLSAAALVVRAETFPGDPHPFLHPAWPEDYRGPFYDPQSNTQIEFG